MELKFSTQSIISSVMYTRLLEIHGHIKSMKKNLTSKIPTVKDLEFFVTENQHYSEVRLAYIEFCNECCFDVDLSFEDLDQCPEVDEDRFYREHYPDEVEEDEE